VIDDPLGDAVRWVRDGGLLAYPTETVWGLGGDVTSETALAQLRRWKDRRAAAPVSILVADPTALEDLACVVGPAARRLVADFWPGPLTLVLPSRRRFARGVARCDGAVGVRCSAHPLAAALARRLASEGVGPLTSTSLNRSGEPPARTREEASVVCRGSASVLCLLAVEGAEAGGACASTVVDLTGPLPSVLRWGLLPKPVLEPVLKEFATP